MAFINRSRSEDRGPDTEDPVFKSLVTPAQRSAAVKIWRLCDSFPWEIIPCSPVTRWTQALLDCFLETKTLSFSGQILDDLDKKKVRSALLRVARRRGVVEPIAITETDIRGALCLLKKTDSQPGSDSETLLATRTISGGKLALKPAAKRVRTEDKSPLARITRSSKRQRGHASKTIPGTSPKTPVPKRKSANTVVISSDDESDRDEAQDLCLDAKKEPDDNQSQPALSHSDEPSPDPDSQLLETIAEHKRRKALSTPAPDAEETNAGTGPASPAQSGSGRPIAIPSRRIRIASLGMTDKQIGDKIRTRLSTVAHKQHLRIEQRLAELDAEAKCARQALLEADSANHGTLKSRQRKQDAISAALKVSEKAHADYEKTVEALQFVQSLGVSNMASAIESLEMAVEDTDKDQRVAHAAYARVCRELSSFEEKAEAVKKELEEADAKFRQICQARDDFAMASEEKNITCTVRVESDARDDGDNLSDDFALELGAAVRQKVQE
ncbi:hypothetical protein Forpe1208_v013829 [Fusarium oxysporum f. sp. rapae]|uniref:Uncharacterized protein n=1 Tax=Fusarium oxysporum f. sp. rapae TaxID=485398 RepID=A0A8J5NK31_FUSOX|nr:hypothetical protein Forpe1208_v013829 [Fusarium oxysporum f. sp. rapae]